MSARAAPPPSTGTRRPAVAFGPFVFDPVRRELRRDDVPVRLGGRAADLLAALLERPCEVLGRDELVARVWPTTVVEETSLRVHVSALRRALGDGRDGARYIANVPGRGYTFIGTLAPAPDEAAIATVGRLATAVPARHLLPPLLIAPVGREATIAALRHQLAQQRLVSIVGAGGMGKTTVALAAAATLADRAPDGIRFVDLSTVVDAADVFAAVAGALDPGGPADRGPGQLVVHVRHQQLLLVLDNCEQVVDAVADLVHDLLSGTTGLRILLTSREPLNVAGEWVHRLRSLDLPDGDDDTAAASVRLFVERATDMDENFALTPTSLPLVHALCRHLDGMPLALELAAARVDVFGLQELVNRLSDMFRLLTRGRRTAAPRHQTLAAAFDWSHDLLDDADRTVLRRLAVFQTAFTLEAAANVVACDRLDPGAAMESLLSLAAKSLVTTDHRHGRLSYRLLSTTRAYALQKLRAAGEWDAQARRHAERLAVRLRRAGREIGDVTAEGRAALDLWLRPLLDDLRAALDWAASPQGHPRLVVELALEAAPLVVEFGAVEEHAPRLRQALAQVEALDPPDPALELRVLSALCQCGWLVAPGLQDLAAPLARLATLERGTDDRDQRLDALHGLLACSIAAGDYPRTCDGAEQAIALAAGRDDAARTLLGGRLLAQGLHGAGRHHEALRFADRVLAEPADPAQARFVGPIPTAVSMRVLQARIAWLQGRPDEACERADEALRHALRENPHALSHALALGVVPVALWRGDRERARLTIEQLARHARGHGQVYWASWARLCRRALDLRNGEPVDPPDTAGLTPKEADLAATLGEPLLTAAACERVDAGQVGWNAPEVRRARVARRLRRDGLAEADAVALLQPALQLAQTQGAAAWALRIATTGAAVRHRGARAADEAAARLERALDRIAGGPHTQDVVRARTLLDALARRRTTSLE